MITDKEREILQDFDKKLEEIKYKVEEFQEILKKNSKFGGKDYLIVMNISYSRISEGLRRYRLLLNSMEELVNDDSLTPEIGIGRVVEDDSIEQGRWDKLHNR